MAGKRKAASIDDESSGSQQSAGSGGQHFSGVRQPAGSEAAGNVTKELIGDVLHTIMRHVTEIVATAHQPSDEPRPALDKSRKLEMRSKSFGPTVHSLQRAYSKLLHENFENEWSSQLAANVRNLTDAIAWKLSVHSEVRAEEGKRLVSSMLEHLQGEFKWEKIITILESAADICPK